MSEGKRMLQVFVISLPTAREVGGALLQQIGAALDAKWAFVTGQRDDIPQLRITGLPASLSEAIQEWVEANEDDAIGLLRAQTTAA